MTCVLSVLSYDLAARYDHRIETADKSGYVLRISTRNRSPSHTFLTILIIDGAHTISPISNSDARTIDGTHTLFNGSNYDARTTRLTHTFRLSSTGSNLGARTTSGTHTLFLGELPRRRGTDVLPLERLDGYETAHPRLQTIWRDRKSNLVNSATG